MEENEMIPLEPDDTFRFACSKNVPCFNECCRDLNQFLTPYDILRMKNGLSLTSGEFLEQYTVIHTGPETGLPVVVLKPADQETQICPFVTEAGCRVYADRPSSCRTYPLVRLASRNRETGIITAQYFLMKESHCRGFEQDRQQTVREWISDQDIATYDRMNDLMMEIISLKNRLLPGQLDIRSQHMFQIALYDTDAFKTQVLTAGHLDALEPDPDLKEKALNDDAALLKLGFWWTQKMIFNASSV